MMETKTDRKGREWRGNAPAEALDEHCDAEDRETLGVEVRTRREAAGISQRGLAIKAGVSHVAIGNIERGDGGSAALLERLGCSLGVADVSIDRWHALAGHVAPDLVAALLDAPERWDAVRALLAGGGR